MLTDHEDLTRQSNVSSYLKRTKEWLSQLIFWYGMTQGMVEADKGHPHSNFFTLAWFDPSRLKYYWYFYYTVAHLVITEDETAMDRFISERGSIANFAIGGKNLNDFPVFGQHNDHLPAQVVVQIVSEIETEIEQYLPGIHAENSLRICSTPKHVWESTGILAQSNESQFTSNFKIPHICLRFGNSYYCEECVKRYNLEDKKPAIRGLSSRQKTVLKHFTPALRASILERDNYTCSKCQRSPVKGDDISLHVCHQIPITDGGDNKPENLVTLCQDCQTAG